jgi:hypothetical protein
MYNRPVYKLFVPRFVPPGFGRVPSARILALTCIGLTEAEVDVLSIHTTLYAAYLRGI